MDIKPKKRRITIASSKQRGRLAQQYVRDAILAKFPQLTERDVKSTSMGASGVDVLLSEAAVKAFPYAIEVKNCEKLSIWAAMKQAEANRTKDTQPLLVIKRNREDYIAILKFSDFMQLFNK